MKRFIPGMLWAGLCLAPLPIQAVLPAWKAETAASWFQDHPDPDTWAAAAESLKKSLMEEHARTGVQVFTRDESFTRWQDHLRWIHAGVALKNIVQNPALLKAFIEVGGKPAIAHEWIRSMTSYDKPAESLEILLRLHERSPADLEEFPTLGVAYAVVFDQAFPAYWPHGQVATHDVPKANPDPVERFIELVKAQRNHELELDLRKLSVQELRFVVDTQISFEELAWARKNVRLSTGKFGAAFGSIRYDTPRLMAGQFTWMLGPYTFESIQKNGGICVDQAYYAANVGKARGLPTLYFHGQGQGGGHAWFGYMERPGKWETDCGRYESQNYPVGEAVNPQTWQPINDSELEWMVADLPKNPAYLPAQSALAWVRMNPGSPPADLLKWVREARALLPAWPQPWMEEARLLRDAGPAIRKDFFKQWITNFDKQSDLKVVGQQQLLEILKKENDPGVADLQKTIVSDNRKKRFDLGIGVGADAIFEKIDTGDWDSAEKEFKRVVRKFDEQGGGNLFYQLIKPYVVSCLEDAQWDRAKDALDYSEKKMEVGGMSILAREFADLRGKVARKWQPPASSTPGGL